MGYTHYWYTNPEVDSEKVKQALADIAKVIEAGKSILAGYNGEGQPVINEREVRFNGIDENGCETFHFPPDFPCLSSDDDGYGFEFCKTRERPYDKIVVACLAILADVLGDDIRVSSGGEHEEWRAGVGLACHATGRDILNPIPQNVPS